MAKKFITKKVKVKFYINIDSVKDFIYPENKEHRISPLFKINTKNFSKTITDGLVIMKQKYVDFVPKIGTRLRYIRSKKPLLFLLNTNPKEIDRRIHKVIIDVEYIIHLNISIICGSCRKLKNDCICQRSHYMVKCFVNLMCKSNGVPIKLCVRKLGVLFNLLDITPKEGLSILGFLISYDKLEYVFKQYIKFTDIKFSSRRY